MFKTRPQSLTQNHHHDDERRHHRRDSRAARATAHTLRGPPIRTHDKADITRAMCLIEDCDGKGVATTLRDALRDLRSHDIVRQDMREAKRRCEARHKGPPKLADFGDRA